MNEPYELNTRCGFVAIVGRPNVGKSTLMNHVLGQKVSITSRKPQTTRHRVMGIHSEGDVQMIFVDTPGMHRGEEKAINRYMNRAADSALADVDVIVLVVDRTVWTDEDQWVLDKLKANKAPVILAINKVDHLEDKQSLLPHMQRLAEQFDFAEVVPLSALRGNNLETLVEQIAKRHRAFIDRFPHFSGQGSSNQPRIVSCQFDHRHHAGRICFFAQQKIDHIFS